MLSAARRLFLREGFEVVSMDAIAEEAGVSKMTLYRHFSDKESLLQAVIEAATEAGRVRMQIRRDRDLSIRDYLCCLGEKMLDFLLEEETCQLGRLISNQASKHPAHARCFMELGPQKMLDFVTQILASEKKKGHLQLAAPAQAAEMLLGMWLGMRLMEQDLGVPPIRKRGSVKQHVAECVDMLLRAYGTIDPEPYATRTCYN